ncbi:24358_t:CDS:2 [Entrophospora sp. SA101]|nr:24358_t:CDS:2 [Entrophospora sp. SA101]
MAVLDVYNFYQDDKIPRPFDTTLTTNLTSSCAQFFKSFLANQDFNDCNSFGFLLQNSREFAVKSRNDSTIGNLMEKICNIDINNKSIDQCNQIYLNYADNVTLSSNCGVDFQNANQVVKEAFTAFKNYRVMQIVGCSKNSTDIYCYQDALINGLGLGLFYLPLGNHQIN